MPVIFLTLYLHFAVLLWVFSFQFRTHKFQFAMQVSKLILLSICLRQRTQCWSCWCCRSCCCCSCRCVQSVLNFVVNDVVDVYVDVYVDALGAQFRKAHYAMAMDEAHTQTHSYTHAHTEDPCTRTRTLLALLPVFNALKQFASQGKVSFVRTLGASLNCSRNERKVLSALYRRCHLHAKTV